MLSTTSSILERIIEKESLTVEEVSAYFDQLPPIGWEKMLGAWRGQEVFVGHPMEGLLAQIGWYGKRFESAEAVHPLLFQRSNGRIYSVNPFWLSMETFMFLMERGWRFHRIAGWAKGIAPLLQTKRGKARLRMIQFRGQLSATMQYDHLPINDHFRQIDEDHLLGWMDFKGQSMPYFFILSREG